jgi:hypothetical protein
MAGSGSGESCCDLSRVCGHVLQKSVQSSLWSPVLSVLQAYHLRTCRSPPSYAAEPALFALDCEMCATATDDKALLSLCLVDAGGEIVLQVHCCKRHQTPGALCPVYTAQSSRRHTSSSKAIF